MCLLGFEDIEIYIGLGVKLNEFMEMVYKVDVLWLVILYKYGGVWLDSDVLVLKLLVFLIEDLEMYEFVGFLGLCNFDDFEDWFCINIFVICVGGDIMCEWYDV